MISASMRHVVEKAVHEQVLGRYDLLELLDLMDHPEQDALALVFNTARSLRERYFGNRVFLYGFVYFSNWCRNDCNFCYYRRSNGLPRRYRLSEAKVVDAAFQLAATGVHAIDLTMGEDAAFLAHPRRLTALAQAVSAATCLPLMVSPGVLSGPLLAELAAAGVRWYALYQESYSRTRFAQLRPHQDFDARMQAKRQAVAQGLLVEEGLLVGLGESREELADSLLALSRIEHSVDSLKFAQVRVMGFVPQSGIPLASASSLAAQGIGSPHAASSSPYAAGSPHAASSSPYAAGSPHAASRRRETLLIAILRLLFPQRLIPASLDVEGLDGLAARLQAGANVVTSIIPPSFGLGGVANSSLDIDNAQRTVGAVEPVLRRVGLQVASQREYRLWLTGHSVMNRHLC
ncbi:MAG: radical SAM protein [Coriobacteriales bacterium]|jgi:methylornithine synthase|nr:radical SAM protein [Coriobacteriales bacterium]